MPAEPSGAPPRVLGLSLDDDGPVTAIRIEGDGPLAYRVSRLPNPPRLILDFPHATHALKRSKHPGRGPLVASVRSSQFRREPGPVVRIVVDLSREAPYWIETLDRGVVIHVGVDRPGAATR